MNVIKQSQSSLAIRMRTHLYNLTIYKLENEQQYNEAIIEKRGIKIGVLCMIALANQTSTRIRLRMIRSYLIFILIISFNIFCKVYDFE